MQTIVPPENCPSCNSKLEWKNVQLYCTNDNCPAKFEKSIEHWAKTLKLKGLGPKTIEKLMLESLHDLYSLTPDSLRDALGSDKLANKLYQEIQKSRAASLDMTLPAFGIPLIGKTATEKLCKVINTLDELTEGKAKEAGLGPKAISNLMTWFETSFKDGLDSLPLNFEKEKQYGQRSLKGVVCISGKLKSFKTKSEAEKALVAAGYKVKSSVTKEVTILINESGIESAKTAKARESGIAIIDNTKELLGE